MMTAKENEDQIFNRGERVLCYEPDDSKARVLYASKVTQSQTQKYRLTHTTQDIPKRQTQMPNARGGQLEFSPRKTYLLRRFWLFMRREMKRIYDTLITKSIFKAGAQLGIEMCALHVC